MQLSDATRPVSTTDVFKLVGLAFVLIDHYGLFFDPDALWWRVLGRIAAPIFFFFIGFARSRSVPWSWIAFGLVLTLSDYLTSESLADTTTNLLLNFALLRWFVLPFVERHVIGHPLRLALLVAVSAALIAATDNVLEYGTEGWLWAFFGLSQRLLLEGGGEGAELRRDALAAAAGLAWVLRETVDYGFDQAQAVVHVAITVALVVALLRFRRRDLAWRAPPALAALLHLCGRRSLEIYAVSLLAMQGLAYGIEAWGEEGEE